MDKIKINEIIKDFSNNFISGLMIDFYSKNNKGNSSSKYQYFFKNV